MMRSLSNYMHKIDSYSDISFCNKFTFAFTKYLFTSPCLSMCFILPDRHATDFYFDWI